MNLLRPLYNWWLSWAGDRCGACAKPIPAGQIICNTRFCLGDYLAGRKPKVFYMCLVDWEHEISHTHVYLYDTEEELREHRKCVSQCGIVKLEVVATVIQPSDYSDLISFGDVDVPVEEFEKAKVVREERK